MPIIAAHDKTEVTARLLLHLVETSLVVPITTEGQLTRYALKGRVTQHPVDHEHNVVAELLRLNGLITDSGPGFDPELTHEGIRRLERPGIALTQPGTAISRPTTLLADLGPAGKLAANLRDPYRSLAKVRAGQIVMDQGRCLSAYTPFSSLGELAVDTEHDLRVLLDLEAAEPWYFRDQPKPRYRNMGRPVEVIRIRLTSFGALALLGLELAATV